MKKNPEEVDFQIRNYLKADVADNKDYWAFSDYNGGSRNDFFKYPATMVPKMQQRLIDIIININPNINSIYEPFVGSGTVMLEAMRRGIDFTGQDINPLAILLCRMKSGPFYEKALKDRIDQLLDILKTDQSLVIEVNFPGLTKWFRKDVSIELSRIVRAIRSEQSLWCRRFYWIALAETVRLTSNARTTTFKLHSLTKDEIEKRDNSPISIFSKLVVKNLAQLKYEKHLLNNKGLIMKGRFIGNIEVNLADSSKAYNPAKLHDLLVTSPPYGDNKSTVAYGQYSYLPLQWIDLKDIDTSLNQEWLSTTNEIDRRSLGGSLKSALDNIVELLDISPNLRATIQALKSEPRDRQLRVAAFWRDMSRCIIPSLSAIKQNAYMVWVVGNRTVGGKSIPMDRILLDFFQANGAKFVERIQRLIPRKRLATKNNISSTMNSEIILIMRKETPSST